MGYNYFVAPGKILEEYMIARDITEEELAEITNCSQRYVADIIKGEVIISEEFAVKLEDVFLEINASFWLELERGYSLYVLENKKSSNNHL